MRATHLLTTQLAGINTLFHAVADDLSDAEWIARAAPGTNPPGFTLWHLARTQDWALQTVIRGLPEVLAGERWAGAGGPATPGMGAGFTADEADRVAATTVRADVLAYADAVHRALLDWLGTIADDDLDAIPDMAAHQAPYPAYQRASFRAEVDDLSGMPTWRFLTGPCVGHIRGHLGELEVLKQLLRQPGTGA